MTQEELSKITETVTGIKVKDLRWKANDNIIVGLVQDPLWGKPELHNGFITAQWRRNGFGTNTIKGREDLKLKIN